MTLARSLLRRRATAQAASPAQATALQVRLRPQLVSAAHVLMVQVAPLHRPLMPHRPSFAHVLMVQVALLHTPPLPQFASRLQSPTQRPAVQRAPAAQLALVAQVPAPLQVPLLGPLRPVPHELLVAVKPQSVSTR